jgi:hypothetical protein
MKTWNYKPINTLDHSHLQNIIKMLWRENTWLSEQMSNLGMEVNLQDKPSCIGYLYIALDKFTKKRSNISLNGDMAEEFNNHQHDAHNGYYDDYRYNF